MLVGITGGAGFIGEYFAKSLLERGMEVVSFDLAPPVSSVPGVTYKEGDIRDEPAMLKAFSGVSRILHLAAAHHDFGIADETFFDVNEEGARCVTRVADRLSVESICFYSSVAVYGEGIGEKDEAYVPQPSSVYGKSKLLAEGVFRDWTLAGSGRNCVIVRPTVTFAQELRKHVHVDRSNCSQSFYRSRRRIKPQKLGLC